MAELILTDEEKAAATWFELNDAAIGKIVKKTAIGLLDMADEQGRVWWFAAALLLVGKAADANAENMKVNVEGFSEAGIEMGDWQVSVTRLPLPNYCINR